MINIKRIIILILLTFSFNFEVNAANDFKLELISPREITTIKGVQHQKLNVKMTFNGSQTNQQINYMGANPTKNPNISLVALDNYSKMDMKRGTILGQIYNSQYRYPNQKIISAVNADFFDIGNTDSQKAATNGPHIRDGQVMFQGYANLKNIYSVGIKVDGTPFISKPEFDGYHIEILDEDGSIKLKDLKVNINQLPKNSSELAVFISSFPTPREIKGEKMLIKINEQNIHRYSKSGSDVIGRNGIGSYFIKGKLERITEEQLDSIPEDIMVLTGNDFFLENLITENDIVRLQTRPSGAFKDVYHAVSGIHPLVIDGKVVSQSDKAVHPRTAAGLKQDGTIFFVVVDGRQAPKYQGVSLEELGEIMSYFGAYTAFNLDGGGSSTMVVLDEKEDEYITQNSPSDGSLRQDGNGVGFIYGPRYQPLPPIPYPDTRTVLNQVNKFIVERNKLMFNSVPNADRYVVTIDGRRYETNNPELNIDLMPGIYDVNVKAYGNHNLYKQSTSDSFNIEIYSSTMQDIMNSLLNYGRNTYEYVND